MGAGKTTIGRKLAKAMGLAFYDLDWYIEARFRMKIPQIFEEKGEAGFRDMEKRMLHELAEMENVVIACGGGTPCFDDNMEYMNSMGDTVFLNADINAIKGHLTMGKSVRPLIQGKSPEELDQFIRESLNVRMPFYAKAKHIVDIKLITTKQQIDDYVRLIADMLE
jgi:shikimate kinase